MADTTKKAENTDAAKTAAPNNGSAPASDGGAVAAATETPGVTAAHAIVLGMDHPEDVLFGLGGVEVRVGHFASALGYPIPSAYGEDDSMEIAKGAARVKKVATFLNDDTPNSHRLGFYANTHFTVGHLRDLAASLKEAPKK